MKNEPVSINRLLSPLNAASPQNIRRQDTRKAPISDRGSSYSLGCCVWLENIRRRMMSIQWVSSRCPRSAISPTAALNTAKFETSISSTYLAGGISPRPLKSVMVSPRTMSPLILYLDCYYSIWSIGSSREMEIVTVKCTDLRILQSQRIRPRRYDDVLANLRRMREN